MISHLEKITSVCYIFQCFVWGGAAWGEFSSFVLSFKSSSCIDATLSGRETIFLKCSQPSFQVQFLCLSASMIKLPPTAALLLFAPALGCGLGLGAIRQECFVVGTFLSKNTSPYFLHLLPCPFTYFDGTCNFT